MKQIKNFDQFERGYRVLESDGFGTMPYLEKKDGNIYYYFFKLDPEKGEEQKGYMLTLGKYSQYEDTPGAKNSYSVINVNEIGTEIIDDIAWHTDEPNGDPVCMPLYYLSKLTHESGTTVIQVGEGSDEQFVGYSWMLQGYNLQNSYWKYYQMLPKALRKTGYKITTKFNPI